MTQYEEYILSWLLLLLLLVFQVAEKVGRENWWVFTTGNSEIIKFHWEWFTYPPGRTLIGMSDEDINNSQSSPSRMTSFSAFFMDQTEISNAEYRQFVNWVSDSVAVTSLGPAGAPNFFKAQPKAAAGWRSQR